MQQQEPTEQGARSRRMLLSLPPSPFPLHNRTPPPYQLPLSIRSPSACFLLL